MLPHFPLPCPHAECHPPLQKQVGRMERVHINVSCHFLVVQCWVIYLVFFQTLLSQSNGINNTYSAGCEDSKYKIPYLLSSAG